MIGHGRLGWLLTGWSGGGGWGRAPSHSPGRSGGAASGWGGASSAGLMARGRPMVNVILSQSKRQRLCQVLLLRLA